MAQGQPTAVTVAFSDPEIATLVQQEFSSETLRLYTSTDVIGVELGGALKNVIAIAAGIAAGVGLGHNSAAALMTRGSDNRDQVSAILNLSDGMLADYLRLQIICTINCRLPQKAA